MPVAVRSNLPKEALLIRLKLLGMGAAAIQDQRRAEQERQLAEQQHEQLAGQRTQVQRVAQLEQDPHAWLRTLYSDYLSSKQTGELVPFAPHQDEMLRWVWAIEPGQRPSPFCGVWPRGHGKSTIAELACVMLGARKRRRYGLYVCETQPQADEHVANIGAMLESRRLELYYPELGQRRVGKYGSARGWSHNRLRTAAGFTVDAVGLDAAARGIKLDEDRPDFMVLDDIDGELDGSTVAERKIKVLTRKLLPAGSSDLAVLAVQNMVHRDSLFARMVDGRADWLTDRIVSGPIPALEGFAWQQDDSGRVQITAGTPTWDGMGVAACQDIINTEGLTAFMAERQHDVEAPPGGMFDHLQFQHIRRGELPGFVRIVVWVDPAVTSSDSSDSHGIQADGLGVDGKVYRLFSWEGRTTPQDVIKRGLLKAVELQAEALGVETDQGGGTWLSVCREAWRELVAEQYIPDHIRPPEFREAKAGAGHGPKVHRAQQMLTDYEAGLIVHVLGTHETLERALRRFPKTKPYDLVDSCYWSWADLRTEVGTPMVVRWR